MENQEIKLNKYQYELLRKYSLLKCCKVVHIGEYFYVNENKEKLRNLLNNISDIFSEIGLDENSEPNQIGLQLEAIIDKVSNIVYK